MSCAQLAAHSSPAATWWKGNLAAWMSEGEGKLCVLHVLTERQTDNAVLLYSGRTVSQILGILGMHRQGGGGGDVHAFLPSENFYDKIQNILKRKYYNIRLKIKT
jgi:hypothetical protein